MKKVVGSTRCRRITCLRKFSTSTSLAAGLQSGQPLFRSVNSLGTAVAGRVLNRYNAWAAIRKRAKAAGFSYPCGIHTWWATGITIHLENDGRLEHVQQMAGHERTTKF